MLRSDLCDYSGAYIVVKENIAVTVPNNALKFMINQEKITMSPKKLELQHQC